jgi:predicted AAA+ superfamily ATPase
MYRKRLMEQRLREAIASVPAVVLVGARQVGKSTLLQHVAPDAAVVVFDPIQDVANARRDPDLFLASQPRPLILDEIQYAPEVAAALKRAIDRDRRPGQYLITGSQQWSVMASLAESLAGRALILDLEGFSSAELADESVGWLGRWLAAPDVPPVTATAQPYPFVEQLWRGFLPEAQTLPATLIPDFHRSYQTTYIERDIRLLADVSDWAAFARFTRLLAALTAQEINRSQLGRDIGITPPTATAWTRMLVATCQWHEVEPWYGNALKRLSKRPKGYAADSGQVCASLAIPSPSALLDHPAFGAVVESALVGDLRRLAACMPTRPVFHHWRSHGGAEVDVVLAYGNRLHPIEIKASSHPGRDDMRGITAFRTDHPRQAQDMALILAPVERGYQVGEQCWVVPWCAQ